MLYLARDKDGKLFLHRDKPKRYGAIWISRYQFIVENDVYVDVSWETGPVKVRMIIERDRR